MCRKIRPKDPEEGGGGDEPNGGELPKYLTSDNVKLLNVKVPREYEHVYNISIEYDLELPDGRILDGGVTGEGYAMEGYTEWSFEHKEAPFEYNGVKYGVSYLDDPISYYSPYEENPELKITYYYGEIGEREEVSIKHRITEDEIID